MVLSYVVLLKLFCFVGERKKIDKIHYSSQEEKTFSQDEYMVSFQ